MKNFITINENFTCKNCGKENPKLPGSCRNHCIYCLCSLHVDKDIPGDRLSNCESIMDPIAVDQSGKKGWIIYHKCQKCDKVISNRSANDDNFDLIIKLTANQNELTRAKKTNK